MVVGHVEAAADVVTQTTVLYGRLGLHVSCFCGGSRVSTRRN